MSDELLHAMCEAYWKAAPGITNSMRNILELLHANGYRRCAEGQRVTQWCDRAEKAEAEVERLRAELDEIASVLPGVAYMDPPDGGSPSIAEQARRMRADLDRTAAEVERLRAEKDAIKVAAWDKSAALLAEHNTLRAEVERLRADAERYRWLQKNAVTVDAGRRTDHEWVRVWVERYEIVRLYREKTLDAAIDAARGES